jgi:hypothetical protein
MEYKISSENDTDEHHAQDQNDCWQDELEEMLADYD